MVRLGGMAFRIHRECLWEWPSTLALLPGLLVVWMLVLMLVLRWVPARALPPMWGSLALPWWPLALLVSGWLAVRLLMAPKECPSLVALTELPMEWTMRHWPPALLAAGLPSVPTECPSLAVALAQPLHCMIHVQHWPPALLVAGLLAVKLVVPT